MVLIKFVGKNTSAEPVWRPLKKHVFCSGFTAHVLKRRQGLLGLLGASTHMAMAMFISLACMTSLAVTAIAQDHSAVLDAAFEHLRLPEPLVQPVPTQSVFSDKARMGRKLPALALEKPQRNGRQIVAVQLGTASVAALAGRSFEARARRRVEIGQAQEQFLARVQRLRSTDVRVIGQVSTVLNVVFLSVDVAALPQLSQDPAVVKVVPVPEYELKLNSNFPRDTVSYIGANIFRWLGVTGRGVTVAVVDTGIDYTHRHLGGSGDPQAYLAAYGEGPASAANTTVDGFFPTAKVIGGYDFLGDLWPEGDPMPDPDPIDGHGHGTSVASIIGSAQGVAPDVNFMAIKACATSNLACPGFALVQALEFAIDPNGDGDYSDRADIINWSLGRPYGQPFDDLLSTAVDAASALGVLSVAAAGNESDRPFIVNTPGSAGTALSVAETYVPNAQQQRLDVGEQVFEGVLQLWSARPSVAIAGTLQYGDGLGGNLNGCEPFDPDLISGRVILVDRGSCATVLKMRHIADAGGVFGVMGIVDNAEPFTTADVGDGPLNMPSYVVDFVTALQLKGQLGETISVEPQHAAPLAGRVVGTSARGPQHEADVLIKPDLAAPGGLRAARAGTGDGESRFGGTSGAAPVVSGAAALLKQIRPDASPALLKARLMNTADSALFEFDGEPAPVTRVGSGELRVSRALLTPVVAWEAETQQPSLSFGFTDIAEPMVTFEKEIVLKNEGYRPVQLTARPRFRAAQDESTGAIDITVSPANLRLSPRASQRVTVRLTVQATMLPDNPMNSGAEATNPEALNLAEFDGFIDFWLDGGRRRLQMPWHIHPRKAARVQVLARDAVADGITSVQLENTGVGGAQLDAFSLIAISQNEPEGELGAESPTPDIRALGFRAIPIPAGVCSDQPSFIINIALTSWERQELLLPVAYAVFVDMDPGTDVTPPGTPDFIISNAGQLIDGVFDGRQLTWVENVNEGLMFANFFAEHATHTANTVLTLCAEQLGLTAADFGQRQMRLTVVAQDAFFGGPGDVVGPVLVTPGLQRYLGVTNGDLPALEQGILEIRDLASIPDVTWPTEAGNTPELGVMLYTNMDRGPLLRGGATARTEMLIIKPIGGASANPLSLVPISRPLRPVSPHVMSVRE
jgi:subtilisin family serine protease